MIPKFRAWHKDKCIMLEVSELIFYSQELYEIKCDWQETKKNKHYCGNKGCHSDCGNEFIVKDFCHEDVDLDEVELMQWTGYKDKSGNDIFENDIVSLKDDEETGKGVIRFSSGMFWVMPKVGLFDDCALCEYADCPDYELEVIGNLYENSDLLNA